MILDNYFIPLLPLHPLVFVTLGLIAGICWQAGSYTLLGAFLAALCLAAGIWHSKHSARVLVFMATALSFYCGSLLLRVQREQFYAWLQEHREPADILMTVVDIAPCSTKNYNCAITARLDKIKVGGTWQDTPYNVIIYTRQAPDCAVCDTIEAPNVTLSKPRTKTDHTYALKNNIGATVFCEKLDHRLVERPAWSAKRWLWNYRKIFTEKLYAKMSATAASFYSLLFMGTYYPTKKSGESLREPFQIWGILHYLARSGLHLVVFIMIWTLVLLAIPCSPRTRDIILLLLACAYFLLSWPTLSFVRAFTTYLLYKAAALARRPSHTLYTITLVTFLFLVANPTHLFCLDFQLSFGLTYALAWIQQSNVAAKNFLTES